MIKMLLSQRCKDRVKILVESRTGVQSVKSSTDMLGQNWDVHGLGAHLSSAGQ